MPHAFPHLHRRPAAGPRQAGFTLVELITVVVILGVLAAVALPRFSGLQGNARAAKADALAGSLRAAAAMVKAQAVASAVSCSTASVTGGVTMEGQAIDLNYCYPQAVSGAAGILGAANIDTARDGVTVSGGSATGGQAVTLTIIGARDTATCFVRYTSPAAADAQATVASTTSGC